MSRMAEYAMDLENESGMEEPMRYECPYCFMEHEDDGCNGATILCCQEVGHCHELEDWEVEYLEFCDYVEGEKHDQLQRPA